MAHAEAIAHAVLFDHRVNRSREHFDVIPLHQRYQILGHLNDPTEDEVLCCLSTLVDLIDDEFQCSVLKGHYDVNVPQLNDYSRQRRRTIKDPSNPNAYGPLFDEPFE